MQADTKSQRRESRSASAPEGSSNTIAEADQDESSIESSSGDTP